ncbi:unnamed protein product [Somion occarium]|uniref:Uncharacterized protein n=1 Tax=Somion occarium TaxID=3059160 RepID=A0ABP1DJL8_9APHY
MEDLKKDSFPSIYDLSNKRFDTWKRSWSTIAGVVYDLYEKPSRWNVYARYFNPRAIEYDIVLTPGTWGRGGEAVTKDLLTRWKDEALKDQLGKARVTVQDTVDSSQFLEIGCHPFEFYRTWIMRDHFDKWVAALCVKGHAGEAGLVRRHPTEDDNECIKAINPEFAYSWTERQNKKAKEDERADQTGISSKVGKKMKINESSTVPVFTDLNSDIEKIESPQVIPDANSKVGRTEEKAQIKAAQKKKLHGVVETCTITITNQKKIQGTVGVKREVSQKDIMFGTSATELAAVLWEFEVKEGERRPIVAEWLHRSAFSFGGLGFPVELNILSTVQQNSQHGNNLVFGTSEANTAMLRYEIAIKDVVMHCASTYPYIACEVNTALEGLDESEPYSAWYSPKILYLYSVTFGDRDTSKTHASSEFQVGKFDTDAKGFDLYSRYRPFLFEGKIDEGLMKAFADLVSKHAVKFKE